MLQQGFSIDTVKHNYVKTQDEFDGVIDNQNIITIQAD